MVRSQKEAVTFTLQIEPLGTTTTDLEKDPPIFREYGIDSPEIKLQLELLPVISTVNSRIDISWILNIHGTEITSIRKGQKSPKDNH